MTPIRIGVSSCLLGQPVRYDGGHKRHDFIVDTLGPFVEFVPVCPEVEIGLGTPRATLRLIRRGGDVRMVMANGEDHSDAMRAYARKRVDALKTEDLSGYLLKKDSPSCGMTRVKVYDENSVPAKTGVGLYAEALRARWPHLPMEDEGRMFDPTLRENFVERVFAYHRLQAFLAERWTIGDLVRFHTRHKLTLLAHSTERYRAMGRLVADAKGMGRAALRDAYSQAFMETLSVLATPKKHANVLMHMVGYFKGTLDTASRDELLTAIDDYRLGLLPLIVPITLVTHHVRRVGVPYLAEQTYLQPHPKELMLRNHT
jgi:uncharacterized protein YbgA (DUF1722 family)/uncharacterized protein YbbK (DUF523 family)